MDRADGAPVAIVNETMARLHWPAANPLGKRINFETVRPGRLPTAPWVEVVGVVADVRHYRIDAPPRPEIYTPLTQIPGGYPWLFLYARASDSEAQAAAALRDLVRSIDPRVSVGTPASAQELMEELTATPRYTAALLAVFGAICLALAVVGVYGLGAFAVAQRRREVGIRLALGATSRDVTRFIVWRGLVPAGCGLAIGAVAAGLMNRALSGLLYGVEASDPRIFAAVLIALLAAAATAAYLPARRATRINPVETLRAE